MYCPYCGSEVPSDAAYCPKCGKPQQAEAPVSHTVDKLPDSQAYAGFWLRFVALLIDGFVLFVATALVVIVFGDGVGSVLLANLLVWMYFAVMESSPQQATLGKQALGLIVTDINGQQLTFGRATGRFFAKYLSNATLEFGYIMAGFTTKKQALHDLIAGTLVLRKPAQASARPPAVASL